ncbi:MAG: hypothetical protein QW734_08940 [Candidatus Bathyarchaeia archaeon]
MEELSKSMRQILTQMLKEGYLTSKKQKIMSTLSFYIGIKDLEKMGLVETDGVFKGGEEKKWKLTKKGLKVARLLAEIEKVLKGDGDAKV